MTEWRTAKKVNGEVVVRRVQWAHGFFDRLVGLMFRRTLPVGEGLVLAYGRESRTETAIHMFFVAFPIAAVYLDRDGVVVDKLLARPWRPFYASRRPAQYVLEADPAVLQALAVGERLLFEPYGG